jgi:hypothetical protein
MEEKKTSSPIQSTKTNRKPLKTMISFEKETRIFCESVDLDSDNEEKCTAIRGIKERLTNNGYISSEDESVRVDHQFLNEQVKCELKHGSINMSEKKRLNSIKKENSVTISSNNRLSIMDSMRKSMSRSSQEIFHDDLFLTESSNNSVKKS